MSPNWIFVRISFTHSVSNLVPIVHFRSFVTQTHISGMNGFFFLRALFKIVLNIIIMLEPARSNLHLLGSKNPSKPECIASQSTICYLIHVDYMKFHTKSLFFSFSMASFIVSVNHIGVYIEMKKFLTPNN